MLGWHRGKDRACPTAGIHTQHPSPGITLCRPHIIYDDELARGLDGDAPEDPKGRSAAYGSIGEDGAYPTAGIHAHHPLLIEHHELTRGLNGQGPLGHRRGAHYP